MTAADDYMQFQDDEDGEILMRGGAPTWPPPERMWLFTLAHADNTPIASCQDADLDQGAEYVGGYYDADHLAVTPFQRASYSQISDADIADMTHVARGALYVPEGSGGR